VPGPGYLPKYTSTVWSLILLAQWEVLLIVMDGLPAQCHTTFTEALPARAVHDERAPSSTLDCLQGNLLWPCQTGLRGCAFGGSIRLDGTQRNREGIAPMAERDAPVRYYAENAAQFCLRPNDKKPCAMGCAK